MKRPYSRRPDARFGAAAAILSAVALVGLASCAEESASPAATKAAPQRRERVELSVPLARRTTAEDVRDSRAAVQRIVADLRDSWTAPFSTGIDVDLPAGKRTAWSSALAATGWPAGSAVPSVRLDVRIDLDGGAIHKRVALSISLAESLAEWMPFTIEIEPSEAALHARIRVEFIGEPPREAANLRLALAAPDLAAAPRDPAPNVLVISVDTLRADHLGCYGYGRATSPAIDALASRGVLFERAYSPAPWTLPAYGSLFTGLLPAEHRAGVVTEREASWGRDDEPAKRTTETLRDDVATLAEILAARGFETAAFTNNPYLASGSGLARGFQQYTSYQHAAQNGVDLALDWLAARGSRPWFLFAHLFDPHFPYAPPKPFDTRFTRQGVDDVPNWPPSLDALRQGPVDDATKARSIDYYDGEIAYTDDQIGRLLARLEAQGLLANTLIVFHSDHGEEFWEHGGLDHGHTQHAELLHVPLVLAWPGKLPAGKRVATRVRALDVLPTVLEIVKASAPPGIAGQSLAPVIDGRESADRDVLSEAVHQGRREIKALESGTRKLVASGASENRLFDTALDARELADRAASDGEAVTRLRARLSEHHARALKSARPAPALKLGDPRLKGLGYVGPGDGSDGDEARSPRKP